MSKVVLALLLLACLQDDKKGPPPDPKPRISMALPLNLAPGATSKITLRGLNLDQATEVKFAEPIEGGSVAIKGKGKAEIPKETDPAVYGDTKVDLEIKLPDGVEKLSLVAVNAAGTTAPHELVVLPKDKVLQEKEPNGGFATAQPVEAGRVVQGAVSQPMDVDVFKIAGKKGETWRIEVEAQRRGSILDPVLQVHDAAAQVLAVSDDSESSRDASVKLTLKADGPCYITVLDAHNTGGATHVYLLRIAREN
ncbi:MAG: hypothetical protein HY293_22390 [Planctomycetes bacterium]|nr:hypothetical protein [Planctomycetota bacterium]